MNLFKLNISQMRIKYLFSAALMVFIFSACSDFELPEEGSLPDLTPPEANFSSEVDDADFMLIKFTNLSVSSTDYTWDFGDGNTSVDKDPSHTYGAEGTYTVTLTSNDKLNQPNTITKEIEVKEPVVLFTPVIKNPGFDIEDPDDYRDGWRNSGLGGVIQITSSPVHDGVKSAKLPSAGDRIGYQLVKVEQNKNYKVTFYYTMKTSPAGTMTVSILGGDVTDPANVAAATLSSVVLNDQTDANTYVMDEVSFNSGPHDMIAIYFTNVDVESRIDTFTISEE